MKDTASVTLDEYSKNPTADVSGVCVGVGVGVPLSPDVSGDAADTAGPASMHNETASAPAALAPLFKSDLRPVTVFFIECRESSSIFIKHLLTQDGGKIPSFVGYVFLLATLYYFGKGLTTKIITKVLRPSRKD